MKRNRTRFCLLVWLVVAITCVSVCTTEEEVEAEADEIAKKIEEESKKVDVQSDAMVKAIDSNAKNVDDPEQEKKFDEASKRVDDLADISDQEVEDKANKAEEKANEAERRVEELGRQIEANSNSHKRSMINNVTGIQPKATRRISIAYNVDSPMEMTVGQEINNVLRDGDQLSEAVYNYDKTTNEETNDISHDNNIQNNLDDEYLPARQKEPKQEPNYNLPKRNETQVERTSSDSQSFYIAPIEDYTMKSDNLIDLQNKIKTEDIDYKNMYEYKVEKLNPSRDAAEQGRNNQQDKDTDVADNVDNEDSTNYNHKSKEERKEKDSERESDEDIYASDKDTKVSIDDLLLGNVSNKYIDQTKIETDLKIAEGIQDESKEEELEKEHAESIAPDKNAKGSFDDLLIGNLSSKNVDKPKSEKEPTIEEGIQDKSKENDLEKEHDEDSDALNEGTEVSVDDLLKDDVSNKNAHHPKNEKDTTTELKVQGKEKDSEEENDEGSDAPDEDEGTEGSVDDLHIDVVSNKYADKPKNEKYTAEEELQKENQEKDSEKENDVDTDASDEATEGSVDDLHIDGIPDKNVGNPKHEKDTTIEEDIQSVINDVKAHAYSEVTKAQNSDPIQSIAHRYKHLRHHHKSRLNVNIPNLKEMKKAYENIELAMNQRIKKQQERQKGLNFLATSLQMMSDSSSPNQPIKPEMFLRRPSLAKNYGFGNDQQQISLTSSPEVELLQNQYTNMAKAHDVIADVMQQTLRRKRHLRMKLLKTILVRVKGNRRMKN